MDAWKLAVAFFAAGCSSAGTQTAAVEAGSDATISGDDASSDSGPEASDAGDEGAEAAGPCVMLPAPNTVASDDCIFAGACPLDCLGGGSAYACQTPSLVNAPALYPSVFTAPLSIVTVVAIENTAYPWDAGAFVSCGPLSCVRWASADPTSALAPALGDPCADGGDAFEAWSCPMSPGVRPPMSGCFNTGGLGAIGGADTGVPVQSVWCCPSGDDAGAPPADAGLGDAADASDAASDAPLPDAAGD
jgi:hypothetical protein